MQLVNIGFGNLVSVGRLIAVVSPDSAPIKRLIQESRDRGMLIDATYGRKTAAVLVMDSDHVVLSALPDLESTCTDASECFDGNKAYLAGRLAVETNQKVRRLIQKDIAALDELQSEMSTARQFLFTARCTNLKREQVFQKANAVETRISEQGFEVHRMKKPEIKRYLALYFETSQYGETLPDVDGAQYFNGIYDNDKPDDEILF